MTVFVLCRLCTNGGDGTVLVVVVVVVGHDAVLVFDVSVLGEVMKLDGKVFLVYVAGRYGGGRLMTKECKSEPLGAVVARGKV